MSPLSDRDLDLLEKMLGRLGSAFDGERATAAAMASRFLRERKLTWGDVLRPPEAAQPRLPAPPCGSWRSLAAECLERGEERRVLGSWEAGFLRSIAYRVRPPTPKQEAVLLRIAAAVGVPA